MGKFSIVRISDVLRVAVRHVFPIAVMSALNRMASRPSRERRLIQGPAFVVGTLRDLQRTVIGLQQAAGNHGFIGHVGRHRCSVDRFRAVDPRIGRTDVIRHQLAFVIARVPVPARVSCLGLLRQLTVVALLLALFSAGSGMPAKIAITANNSI